MTRLFLLVFSLIYAAGVLVGYAYFRSDALALKLRENSVYMKIEPWIDDLLGAIAKDGPRSGRITAILKGNDVRFRPTNSLGFLPARSGQEFFGRTVVATGSGTKIQITSADGAYTFEIGENATFILDNEDTKVASGGIREITIQVVGGEVKVAKNNSNSPTTQKAQLKLVSETGEESVLSNAVAQVISKPVAVNYVPSKKRSLADGLSQDMIASRTMENVRRDLIEESKLNEEAKQMRLSENKADDIPIIDRDSLASLQQSQAEKDAPKIQREQARIPASIQEPQLPEGQKSNKAWQVLATVLKQSGPRRERPTISSKSQLKGIESLSGDGVFDTITRRNLDEVVQSYVRTGQCSDAKLIIDKVTEAFPNDKNSRDWSLQWKRQGSSVCKF